VNRPRILVVDDEQQIQRFLRPSLTAAGYDVVAAATGAEALRLAAQAAPEAVLLDLGLPDIDGKDIIAQLRTWSDVPVIVLSARDREAEKIAALDLGANDYVGKPFGIGELLARLRAVLRQRSTGPATSPRLALGDLTLDIDAHKAARAGQALRLTPKEFDLLALFMRHPGRVLTHRQILGTVWGPAHHADTQYLRVFVGQLRQKIETDPAAPRIILTEPGVGYRIVDPAEE
jgi:two-component system KDP operon response regulator KdpE